TSVGYQSARGDFTYFDDNGTLLNPNDDGYRVRGHNGFSQLDAATRIATEDRRLEGGARLAWKRQDLPGSTTQPARAAELATLDVIGDLRHEARVGGGSLRTLVYGL